MRWFPSSFYSTCKDADCGWTGVARAEKVRLGLGFGYLLVGVPLMIHWEDGLTAFVRTPTGMAACVALAVLWHAQGLLSRRLRACQRCGDRVRDANADE